MLCKESEQGCLEERFSHYVQDGLSSIKVRLGVKIMRIICLVAKASLPNNANISLRTDCNPDFSFSCLSEHPEWLFYIFELMTLLCGLLFIYARPRKC